MLTILKAESGLLFRITHVANLPWLLANGLHAASGDRVDPGFVPIGNPDLIGKRARHQVPIPPGGTLSDYVPFYLTPKSIMLMNIGTGWNGVTRRANEDIAILVSSCQHMASNGVSMLYTDRHAYAATATWIDNSAGLAEAVDWDILRRHDFSRDDAYPDKKERYQAEALAHRYVPVTAILGIACVSKALCPPIEAVARRFGVTARVVARPDWYFL